MSLSALACRVVVVVVWQAVQKMAALPKLKLTTGEEQARLRVMYEELEASQPESVRRSAVQVRQPASCFCRNQRLLMCPRAAAGCCPGCAMCPGDSGHSYQCADMYVCVWLAVAGRRF